MAADEHRNYISILEKEGCSIHTVTDILLSMPHDRLVSLAQTSLTYDVSNLEISEQEAQALYKLSLDNTTSTDYKIEGATFAIESKKKADRAVIGSKDERQVEESALTTTRHREISVKCRENEMIDRLSREDFYEESDYYDGLDGEYNDIDYNEVIDYFAD